MLLKYNLLSGNWWSVFAWYGSGKEKTAIQKLSRWRPNETQRTNAAQEITLAAYMGGLSSKGRQNRRASSCSCSGTGPERFRGILSYPPLGYARGTESP